jgi:competence ComEA-like helix-hairpin-helix protein
VIFNFTKQERQAILFLAVVALAGNGIGFFAKRYAPVRTIVCLDEDFGKINLNTADAQLLKKLPGVGDATARRIIEYRSAKGSFSDISDLRNIKGLSGAKFERIRDSVTVKGHAT